MSDDDNFLARWSRRKREATEIQPAAVPSSEVRATETLAPAQSERDQKPDMEFDPASLPPIESITSFTDVSDFLRTGVPLELTRAALRRAWVADPTIRDFVGLAENDWDFTKPGVMPGFGSLESTDDVRRMVAEVMNRSSGGFQQADPPTPGDNAAASNSAKDCNALASGTDPGSPTDERKLEQEDTAQNSTLPDAKQDTLPHVIADPVDVAASAEPDARYPILRRTHGSALPE